MFCEEGTEGCYRNRPHSDVHRDQNQAPVPALTVGSLLGFDGREILLSDTLI